MPGTGCFSQAVQRSSNGSFGKLTFVKHSLVGLPNTVPSITQRCAYEAVENTRAAIAARSGLVIATPRCDATDCKLPSLPDRRRSGGGSAVPRPRDCRSARTPRLVQSPAKPTLVACNGGSAVTCH